MDRQELPDDDVRLQATGSRIGANKGTTKNTLRPARDVISLQPLQERDLDLGLICDCGERNLLSFTQSASFAPLGSTTTEMTFHVAGSQQRAVVHGMGIVFSSVDKPNTSYVEYFDENGASVARIYAPVQSHGPFPLDGPVSG